MNANVPFGKVYVDEINFQTKAELEWKDLTVSVQECIKKSNMKNGIANISVPGSTGSIISIESEDGLLKDLMSIIEELAPRQGIKNYQHEERWHDGNAHSHLRATFLGASLTLPFFESKLNLGTWQQIVFVEFDIRPRNRKVFVSCLGI